MDAEAYLPRPCGAGVIASGGGRRPDGRTAAARAATPSREVTLSDAEVAALKDKGYKAALLWHTSSDFVNAVTAGATDEFATAGIEVVVTTDAGFDAAKQRSDIETVLAAKPERHPGAAARPGDLGRGVQARPSRRASSSCFLSNVPAGYKQGTDYVGDRHRRPLPDGQAGGRRAGQGASAARARSAGSSTTPTTT